jgi:hypothetical protein
MAAAAVNKSAAKVSVFKVIEFIGFVIDRAQFLSDMARIVIRLS